MTVKLNPHHPGRGSWRARRGRPSGIVLRGNGFATTKLNVVCVGIGGAMIEEHLRLPGHQCFAGSVDATIVHFNVIYDAAGGIVAAGGDRVPGPDGLVIVNNTVALADGGGWALRLAANGGIGTDNVAFNNILFSDDPAGGSIALEGDVGFASARNAVVDRLSTDDGTTILTLAQFQSEGYELGSLISDATRLFVGAATEDYRIRAGCPAVDAGLSELNGHAAAALDLRGTVRPVGSSWDLGAYEFCAGWTCDGGGDAGAGDGGDGGDDGDAGGGGGAERLRLPGGGGGRGVVGGCHDRVCGGSLEGGERERRVRRAD